MLLLPSSTSTASLALCSLFLLGGCASLLTEGTSAGAGVGGAAVAHAVTKNGAVVAGIGLGAQAGAMVAVQYAERQIHQTEQDAIAQTAGSLPASKVAHWSVVHKVPIEDDEQGEVTVVRTIGSAASTGEHGTLDCKEIVFSVDTVVNNEPHRAFYTAAVCRDGTVWKWATAEPATERWGSLQ
jgi:hypothetical protein